MEFYIGSTVKTDSKYCMSAHLAATSVIRMNFTSTSEQQQTINCTAAAAWTYGYILSPRHPRTYRDALPHPRGEGQATITLQTHASNAFSIEV